MKRARVDWLPLAAIACGGTLGSLVITTAIAELDDDHVVRHEIMHVETTGEVTVEPERDVGQIITTAEVTPSWNGEGTRVEFRSQVRVTAQEGGAIRIRGDEGLKLHADPKPLIYLDGVRLDGDASIQDIDPETIDRIEIVKNEAAVRLFGEEAVGGVIQIFLKKDAGSR